MSNEVLVTGARGMLGQDLVDELTHRGWNVKGIDLGDLDITDPTAVARIGTGEFGNGGWLVNCAAYTAVDKAETEIDLATLVNSIAPGYLAQASSMCGKRMIHISTDFVFDGTKSQPYQADDPVCPLSAYGRTKLEGEEAALQQTSNTIVVRTAWLYGPKGNCFPKAITKAWESGRELKVVADQVGSPTYTSELARVIVDIMDKDLEGGIYHATGTESMSWHEFAQRAIHAYSGQIVKIEPISTEGWPTPAKRPKYSVLSFEKLEKLGVRPMRSVDDCLKEFWIRLKQDQS